MSKEIEDLNNERDSKLASINENPFLSESARVRNIQRTSADYESKIANRVDQLQLAQDSYEEAVSEAKFAVPQAVNMLDTEKKFNLDQLDRVIESAERKARVQREESVLAQKQLEFEIETA